jgi:sugar O-acyltransferase (sialic acid O-acetyltransferase NeuD family)
MKNLILIGAGAWALEVWSWIKHSKGYGTEFTFKGFLSNNLNEIDEKKYCNGKIIGVIDGYEPKVDEVFICAIGNVAIKRRITLNFEKKGAVFINLIHNSVITFNGINLGKGIIVSPFCVLSNNCKISNHVSINLNSSIGHDTKIGPYSVISSHCDLTGFVELGENVFLGSSVTIAPSKKICSNVLLGIGSVVMKNIRKEGSYIGNPVTRIN